MQEIVLIAHNIRSTHNIGAIFRTAEGFGVSRIICSGYSPYPRLAQDMRLPHLSEKITKQINKTALGAELLVPFEHQETPDLVALRRSGFTVVGLEQDAGAISLAAYNPPATIALLLGEEVNGIDISLRDECEVLLEIPMQGSKESFNVSVATGIALYGLSLKF